MEQNISSAATSAEQQMLVGQRLHSATRVPVGISRSILAAASSSRPQPADIRHRRLL
ncbi:hypothetical protein AM571_PB00315 (plasmid) [Rhizobium etli 8C-3]|uniref:Uncharacterized protein n=1 Tax=Rhizobium etli 8C-3 TaxID=538025 RepID=A0A1L5PBL9_RHIET|nr:hypothetical protein AM571_PB00315 [Rhizobium etli 8C-3]